MDIDSASSRGLTSGPKKWPYFPQLIVFILILAAGGTWFWWCQRGDWVAQINGEKISAQAYQSEYNRVVDYYYQVYGIDLKQPSSAGINKQIKKSVLQQMIDLTLLKQAACRSRLSVPPAQVEVQLAMIAINSGGQEQLEKILRAHGYTLEQYRQSLRDNLLIQQLQTVVTSRASVSDQEVRAYYNKYGKQFPDGTSYNDVKEPIRQTLLTEKKNRLFLQYLDRVRVNSRIIYSNKMAI